MSRRPRWYWPADLLTVRLISWPPLHLTVGEVKRKLWLSLACQHILWVGRFCPDDIVLRGRIGERNVPGLLPGQLSVSLCSKSRICSFVTRVTWARQLSTAIKVIFTTLTRLPVPNSPYGLCGCKGFKVSRFYWAFCPWGLESKVTFTQCIPYNIHK